MVQDIPDLAFLARPSLAPALAAMVAHGLVFDALIKTPHIPATLALLSREPQLTVVIDHGAKPDLVAGDLGPWREGIKALAAHPGTFCKLSGLVTEAGRDWNLETLRPVVAHLLLTFGPDRLIFGSDWPVVTLRAPYERWFDAAQTLLDGCSEDERAAIFGGTAQRVYCARRGRL
jgi:L-fuconolactonase